MIAHQQIRAFFQPQPEPPISAGSDDGRTTTRALEPARRATLSDGAYPYLEELARAVAERIRSRPLSSIAVALGVGFVVGGALTFKAGRVALAAAARHLAKELLKQVL